MNKEKTALEQGIRNEFKRVVIEKLHGKKEVEWFEKGIHGWQYYEVSIGLLMKAFYISKIDVLFSTDGKISYRPLLAENEICVWESGEISSELNDNAQDIEAIESLLKILKG